MKYGEVQGPVTGKYKGWIKLEHAEHPPRRREGQSSGDRALNTILFRKKPDTTSHILQQDISNGNSVNIRIDFVKPDALKTVYLRLELDDVMIASLVNSNTGKGGPMENLTLDCGKVTETWSFARRWSV